MKHTFIIHMNCNIIDEYSNCIKNTLTNLVKRKNIKIELGLNDVDCGWFKLNFEAAGYSCYLCDEWLEINVIEYGYSNNRVQATKYSQSTINHAVIHLAENNLLLFI